MIMMRFLQLFAFIIFDHLHVVVRGRLPVAIHHEITSEGTKGSIVSSPLHRISFNEQMIFYAPHLSLLSDHVRETEEEFLSVFQNSSFNSICALGRRRNRKRVWDEWLWLIVVAMNGGCFFSCLLLKNSQWLLWWDGDCERTPQWKLEERYELRSLDLCLLSFRVRSRRMKIARYVLVV